MYLLGILWKQFLLVDEAMSLCSSVLKDSLMAVLSSQDGSMVEHPDGGRCDHKDEVVHLPKWRNFKLYVKMSREAETGTQFIIRAEHCQGS